MRENDIILRFIKIKIDVNNNQYTYNQPPMGQGMPQGGMIPPQAPMPMSRRARLGQRLMSGVAMKMQGLPDWFATYAVATYAIALAGVNFVYSSYAMEWYFMLFGIVWVAGFFFLSIKYTRDWSIQRVRKSKTFEKKLFLTGFGIRAAYAIFIYFYYIEMTGQPHEFQASDSVFYMELTGVDWIRYWDNGTLWSEMMEYGNHFFSDMGYSLFLLLPIRIFGIDASHILIRLIQAVLGAYTAVIIYRLTARSMGETIARMTAIFCMLHPVLICYVGMILKEVLMTWLVVLFIDIADRMLRSRRYSFSNIAPLVFIGFLLFMFRTVLGMIAFMAVFFALIMMDTKIVSFGRKIVLGIILAGVLLMAASDTIIREIQQVTETDVKEQQEKSLESRYGEKKSGGGGNAFAKYAGAAVFAPLIFTIPFPTVVTIEDQEDMRLIHGGNWMRNVMSGFVILAMVMLLISGDWRKYTLPLAMLLGYLLMLAFTQFAHSLRFHIPVMPFEMMFAAYAITNMRKKHKNWYLIWCLVMVLACFAWNWFKLAGRGLA